MKKKAIATWSGGKDSCLACYKLICQGFEITHLFNTVSQEYRRVRFHGVEEALIADQAKALEIPLVQVRTSPEGYGEEFRLAFRDIITHDGLSLSFGDIHLQDCFDWAQDVGHSLGLSIEEPLWKIPPADNLLEFINLGFSAIVVSTQGNLLGREWVGRMIDHDFFQDITALKHIDPAGENGEYHTLVLDGPMFKERVQIDRYEKVLREGYWFLDIKEYGLRPKHPALEKK